MLAGRWCHDSCTCSKILIYDMRQIMPVLHAAPSRGCPSHSESEPKSSPWAGNPHAIPSRLLLGAPLSLALFCTFCQSHWLPSLSLEHATHILTSGPLNSMIPLSGMFFFRISTRILPSCLLDATSAESLSLTTLCRSCPSLSARPIPLILLVYSPKQIMH